MPMPKATKKELAAIRRHNMNPKRRAAAKRMRAEAMNRIKYGHLRREAMINEAIANGEITPEEAIDMDPRSFRNIDKVVSGEIDYIPWEMRTNTELLDAIGDTSQEDLVFEK